MVNDTFTLEHRLVSVRLTRALRTAVGVVVAALAAVFVGIALQRRRTAEYVETLRRAATTDRTAVFTTDELDGLPEPVQDYFTNVLEEGQQYGQLPHPTSLSLTTSLVEGYQNSLSSGC